MAGAPHIASTHGNSCENAEYARPADEAHLAYSLPKPLKIHDRTKPHLAAFYPAVLIGCAWDCLSSIVVSFSFHSRTLRGFLQHARA
jgi:hypothetical protein